MLKATKILKVAKRVVELEGRIEALQVERQRLLDSLNGKRTVERRVTGGESIRSEVLKMLGPKPVSSSEIVAKLASRAEPKDIRSVLSALKRAGVAKNPSRGAWVKVGAP